MKLEKTIKNLEARGFKVQYFDTKEEAAEYICKNTNNTAVGIGGSKTVEAMDLYDKLLKNNEVFWHWKLPGMETLKKANNAPVYISSVNAITEDGELLSIDGNGNRLAGQVFGIKKLYLVAGTNKIADTFENALARARNVAAVKNAERFDIQTPCKNDGVCHDCKSHDRICRALLVLWAPVKYTETEVILIGEKLGF